MENSVAQNLEFLTQLQAIDSQIDSIMKIRGDLPNEVRDLEDEIIGIETRISKFEQEAGTLKDEIGRLKLSIKDSDKLIKKYQEQQGNVKNNREFEAIAKEIESQELDIQLYEKKIKEANVKIEAKNVEIEAIKLTLGDRKKDLQVKKSDLETIIGESQEEESKLVIIREEAMKKVDERLLFSYSRLRGNYANGLSVVSVKRGACGGCFNMVPPQRQADIRDRKKIIVCEHCGRILANVETTEFDTFKLK
jgi:predicted  nucleic acid-binding Zn-ribbon protein